MSAIPQRLLPVATPRSMPPEEPPGDDCYGQDPAEQGHHRLDERGANPDTDAHQQYDPDGFGELLHGEPVISSDATSAIASSIRPVKQRKAKRRWLLTKRPVRATNRACPIVSASSRRYSIDPYG